MTVFVFCVNLLVAAFILVFIVEIFTLLLGSLGAVLKVWKRRHGNA